MTFTKNIPILMYHHVTANGGSLAVSAGHFESQIRGLAKAGYHALSTTDLANFYSGAAIPEKSVLITFDDGYLDNWVYAHPVLQRYGFCAVLFAITGLIGNGPVRPHAGQSRPLPNCPDHHEAKRVMFGPEPDRVMLRWSEIEAMLAAGVFR